MENINDAVIGLLSAVDDPHVLTMSNIITGDTVTQEHYRNPYLLVRAFIALIDTEFQDMANTQLEEWLAAEVYEPRDVINVILELLPLETRQNLTVTIQTLNEFDAENQTTIPQNTNDTGLHHFDDPGLSQFDDDFGLNFLDGPDFLGPDQTDTLGRNYDWNDLGIEPENFISADYQESQRNTTQQSHQNNPRTQSNLFDEDEFLDEYVFLEGDDRAPFPFLFPRPSSTADGGVNFLSDEVQSQLYHPPTTVSHLFATAPGTPAAPAAPAAASARPTRATTAAVPARRTNGRIDYGTLHARRQYACTICTSRFTRDYDRRRHEQRVHRPKKK